MDQSRLVLLLVDPDEATRRRYSHALAAGAGDACQVLEAATGAEALALLANALPDGLFLSAALPDMDPATFVQALAAGSRSSGIGPYVTLLLEAEDQDPTPPALAHADDVVVRGPLAATQLRSAAARLGERRLLLKGVPPSRPGSVDALTLEAFLANHRHDLRSPLNAVLGYSEMLQEELQERGQDDLCAEVDRIREAGRLLLSRIDELVPPQPDAAVPPAERTAEPPVSPSGAASSEHTDAADPRRTVLVIDDDADTRDLFTRFLRKGGYHVAVASGGREGLAVARRLQPAVITVDMMMPDIDGWAVFDAVRSDAVLADTPVIMLTGQGNERMAVGALKQGLDDYLVKGDITAPGLRRAVEGVLDQQRLRREVAHAQQAMREAHEALLESEQRYRLLAERVSDVISRHAPDGTVLFASAASHTLFGYPPTDLVGRRVDRFVHPDDRATLWQAHAAAAADGGHTYLVSYRLRKHDGQYTWVETTGQILQGDQLGEIVAVTRDITDRKLAEEQLAFHAEELARSNRDLEQFAYIASHDLQEPLRAVNGYLRLLERQHSEALGTGGLEKVSRALRSVAYMQKLIANLLAYARLNARRNPFAPVDLDAVLDAALEALDDPIRQRAATIEREPLPTVLGDDRQLTQVLQNLLSNALKFSRKGVPPAVQVTALPGDQTWRILVRDNGIGIEPEYAERIFAIFHRLNAKEDYPGTGIGLAVCKRVIERHQGQIWVEPATPHGSVFCLELPLHEMP